MPPSPDLPPASDCLQSATLERTSFGEDRRVEMDRRKGRTQEPARRYAPRATTADARERVLRAAATLFARYGIPGVSLRGLARQAGVAVTTVNYVAGRRDEVLSEVMIEYLLRQTRRVLAAETAAAGKPPQARLEAMLLAYLDGIALEPDEHHVLRNGVCAISGRGRDTVRWRMRALLQTIAAPLEEITPEVAKALPGILCTSIVASVGDALLWFEPKAEMSRAEIARHFAAMLIAGVLLPLS